MSNELITPPEGFRPYGGEVPKLDEVLIEHGASKQRFIGPRSTVGMDLPRPAAAVSNEAFSWSKMAQQGALPALGGLAGGALGTMVAGPPGGLVGTMFGSGYGEIANQQLGITPGPDPLQVGVATALPVLSPALRGAMRNVPGAEAGLQQKAVETARTLPGRLAPKVDPADLYTLARQAGVTVPKGPLGAAMADVVQSMDEIAPLMRPRAIMKATGAIQQILDLKSPEVPLTTLMANISELGKMYRVAVAKGGRSQEALGNLYSAIQDSLDIAGRRATGPAILAYRQANEQFKRQLAQTEMGDLIQKNVSFVAGHEQFGADAVLKALDKGGDLYKSMSRWVKPEEIDDIVSVVQSLSKVPAVSAAGKGGFGGLQVGPRILIGGTVGGAIGGPAGAATGVIATEALTRALMSPAGRTFIKAMAGRNIGGTAGPTMDMILNAVMQFSRPDPRNAISSAGNIASKGVKLGQDVKDYLSQTPYMPK